MTSDYTGSQSIFATGFAAGFSLGVFSARLLIEDTDSHWRQTALDQLNALCALEHGWDGYDAGPVNFDNANFAMQMLSSICGPDTLPPQIVPGFRGDLQLEWHTDQGDIELHVRAPYDVSASSEIGGLTEEIELKNDFSKVADWIVALQRSRLAEAATT